MRRFVAEIAFPLALACATALLVRSYEGVGDGFSAAVLAAALALLEYFTKTTNAARRTALARSAGWALRAGTLTVVLVGWSPLLFDQALFTHFPPAGGKVHHFGALPFHSAFVFDAGVALAVYGGVILTFDHVFPNWSGEEA